MGVCIGKRLSRALWRSGGVYLTLDAADDFARVGGGVALYKALADGIGVALDGVAVLVAERADSGIQTGNTRTLPAEDGVGIQRIAACPRLAVHKYLSACAVGIEAVEIASDFVHGGDVVQTHQVKAEAVDMILVHPVFDGLDHKLAVHLLVGSRLVAATRAVGELRGGVHAVIVTGNGLFKAGSCVVGMVVNNVHDDGDVAVMERLDHLLEFLDSDVAVIGIRGIGTLGSVVVLRVIAPVAVGGRRSGLVNGLEVIDGHELDAVDALLNEIVDTCGDVARGTVERRARLGEAEVLSSVVVADARALGSGEVAHMYFPDNRFTCVLEHNMPVAVPAVRVGGIEVDDHRAVAVDADSLGINILRLVGLSLDADDVGVILILVVAVQRQAPYARVAVFGHGVFADGTRAGLAVRAGLIELHLYGGSFGRPCFEGRGRRRIGAAEVLYVVRLFCVVFEIALVTVGADNIF